MNIVPNPQSQSQSQYVLLITNIEEIASTNRLNSSKKNGNQNSNLV